MSNTLGTLNGALILQKALSLVYTKRPLLKMISKGFKDLDGKVESALLGQSVKSRIKSVQAVNAFGTGAGNVSDTDVSVTLSAQKEVHVAFGPAEYNATDRDLIQEAAEPIAVAIANHIVDSVAALWTTAHYSSNVNTGTYTYSGLLLSLRKAMAQAGIGEEDRFAVFNSDVYNALLADPIIVAALNNPLNGNAIAEGKLPKVAGIQIAEYPSLSSNSEGRIGFAGRPESSVYVARAPKGPGEIINSLNFPGVIDYITDPVTGFSVQVNQWIDPSTLVVNNRLTWLEGFAVGNPAQGLMVIND